MKKLFFALFIPATIFIFSCGEKNPRAQQYHDGTASEDYSLPDGRDSSVVYTFYNDKTSPRKINITVKKNERAQYQDVCCYDSATGKRYSEEYYDSTGALRHLWVWYRDKTDKFVTEETFCRRSNGNKQTLHIKRSGHTLAQIIYYSYPIPADRVQHYDSLGRIESIAVQNAEPVKDSMIYYDTPELKAAFHDALLEMANEMKRQTRFPTGN